MDSQKRPGKQGLHDYVPIHARFAAGFRADPLVAPKTPKPPSRAAHLLTFPSWIFSPNTLTPPGE